MFPFVWVHIDSRCGWDGVINYLMFENRITFREGYLLNLAEVCAGCRCPHQRVFHLTPFHLHAFFLFGLKTISHPVCFAVLFFMLFSSIFLNDVNAFPLLAIIPMHLVSCILCSYLCTWLQPCSLPAISQLLFTPLANGVRSGRIISSSWLFNTSFLEETNKNQQVI